MGFANLVTRFGQIDPPGRMPGICWVVELHTDDDQPPYPLAQAWLSDYRKAGLGMVLDFILVEDGHRRHGFGKALVRACQKRWPDLTLTDPISESGAALLRSLDRDEAPQAVRDAVRAADDTCRSSLHTEPIPTEDPTP